VTSLVGALLMAVAGASVGVAPIAALLHRARQDLFAARRALHEDDLTGLANRRAFLAYLDCARAHGRPIAVALLDVNQFKKVNDNYGHEAGDRVLCALADRLRSVPYPVRLCARLAGDEFVIVIDGDASAAMTVARYVWRIIPATPVDIGGHQLAVTVSIGVAAASGIDYEQLLRNADRAMYEAKETGCGVSVEPPPVRAGADTAERVTWPGVLVQPSASRGGSPPLLA
jgi:diguanylate cyclase